MGTRDKIGSEEERKELIQGERGRRKRGRKREWRKEIEGNGRKEILGKEKN